ncbi:MAG: LacI family DNA-binding transcriptional regulator [Verrucomicrobia bacterium]|nr:LacI family DNA-binding transcriptional regulator [Verrucomicrobiota bacterium]
MPFDSKPRPSLRDMARQLGMSHVAVSLALRDSPNISAKRRLEVKALAEKLGYQPDPMLTALTAYRLAKRSTKVHSCIAWLNLWAAPEELRTYKEFDGYWRGAALAAEKLGYRLEEFCWSNEKPGGRLQTILQTRGIRGILLPPHKNGFHLSDFNWDLFSVVRFGASVVVPRVHAITSDQSFCGRLAYQKAHEKGYRRIGYISSEVVHRNTSGHFREGYLNVQKEIALKPNHLEPLELDRETPKKHPAQLKAWLARQRPDAVITTENYLRTTLASLGLRIPEDLAVAGLSMLDGNFDSGVDQNPVEIGRVAVSTLASLIVENERGIPPYARRILVEGKWHDGTSLPSKTTDAPASDRKPRQRSPRHAQVAANSRKTPGAKKRR